MSSSRSAERLEKKLQNALRECQKRPENKRCADCMERLPQWVVTDFNTFVCTACSGIHREFSHRVKSISLATFSEEEVAGVKRGGNEVSNKLYMARYRPGHDLPEPNGGRAEKHREFIRTKYVDKRWYATPEDLEKDKQREKEREAAKAKRDKKDSGSSTGNSGGKGGPTKPERGRRGMDKHTRRIGLLEAAAVAAKVKAAEKAKAVKPPPAPKKQADLLDFLSDGPTPTPAPAPAPAQSAPPAQQGWAAFGSGPDSAAGSTAPPPPPAPPATGEGSGFASWAAFGDSPAAPQQQPQVQQQATGFPFQDGSAPQAPQASGASFPSFGFSASFPPQQQQPQQQQPQHQHAASFGSLGTPSGGQQMMPPAVAMSPTVMGGHPSHSPNVAMLPPQAQQQGFVGYPMAGGRVSAPGTPVQQPQPGGGYLPGVQGGSPAVSSFTNGGNAGPGFEASFERMTLTVPPAGGPQPQGHQRSGSQQGGVQPQGAYNPGVAQQQHQQQQHQQQQHQQQQLNSGTFYGGGMGPQQTIGQQGFAAFGQQPQFQHQMGQNQPQYPQQQQPNFQGQPVIGQGQPVIGQGHPVIGQGMQQPGPQFSSPYQQQQYQQAGMGMGMGPGTPVQQAPVADVDPFKELAEGGSNGATGDNSGQESRFEKGDHVFYIRGSDPPLDGVIQKVHTEEYPPYYTVLIAVTGREKNTDAAHLRHKDVRKEGVTNGRGHQQGHQKAGPDAFALLGAEAWGTTGHATVAAPLPPRSEPQQPQPSQVAPHFITKPMQPPVAGGMGGDVGGGVNPFEDTGPSGLTVEQAPGNPFDMF